MNNREVALEIIEMMNQEKKFMLTDEHIMLKGEKAILCFLNNASGDVTAGELSKELGVSTARIAAALNVLEQKGLITRKSDAIDKRKVYVQLTAPGQQSFLESQEAIVKLLTKVVDELGKEKIKEHIMIIAKIKRIIEKEHVKKEDAC